MVSSVSVRNHLDNTSAKICCCMLCYRAYFHEGSITIALMKMGITFCMTNRFTIYKNHFIVEFGSLENRFITKGTV